MAPPSSIFTLQENAKEDWPNDKDLISSEDFLKVQAFGGYFLLADKHGYLGYVSSKEELVELINAQSQIPGSLRERTGAPIHEFKSRGLKTKVKFDINDLEI